MRDSLTASAQLGMVVFIGLGMMAAWPTRYGRLLNSADTIGWTTALNASHKVDINTANESELARLPGIGPVVAGRIIAYRTKQGPVTSLAMLDRIPGIGPKTLAALEEYIQIER